MQATFQQQGIPVTSTGNDRQAGKAIKRGLLNRCPSCGEGHLFRAFLKPVDACSVCGEEMKHHRADDLPPYIVITIVGHIALAGYMMTDLILPLTTWMHLAIWVPVTLMGALGLMQPVKGGVIGLQWALKMHGFGEEADKPADDLQLRDPAA
ncbi:DUF983 domain-containing protein [Rhizobium sp. ARZ01]|uniref:DUF983 domain-containing protein n=1 Tax=Rhizobium sp. ARZ01 TaxID=2769313 RepID=UPI00177DCDE2|nr:DUF983 domain-containing protein [Rhizobium sp. ARZ01]MBD9371871.1 DUF983 domain-containing protein [Rhizobium sp. ARZ01]